MLPRLSDTPAPAPLYADLLAELRLRGFAGDLAQDYGDRLVSATDNSIYQLMPQIVVFPRSTEDLVRVARVCGEPRFAPLVLAPRGGGTGTNGQSLTDGMVVDVSRHMNAILEINPAERWVRVQAGVVKDQLNAALAEHGLFFPPELSTSNRATIGGMISTDASGQGSCLYGKTRDHVLELTIVLLDGTVWTSRPLDEQELRQIQQRGLAATGVELVGVDPSMTLAYRSEYAELSDNDCPPVLLVQEWLARHLDAIPSGRAEGAEYSLLPHCSERSLAVSGLKDWQRAFAAAGASLRVLPSGCCGMAGTYGHEAEHRSTSERIYDMSWRAHVARHAHSGRLLATGYSCRSQVKLVDQQRLRHPAQALLACLRGG